jgi:hypothetical protein
VPDWQGFVVADEIKELYELIDYRPAVMAEAVTQRNAFDIYWRGLLMSAPGSHPATIALSHIALHIGEFQAMHYKLRPGSNRPPRPRPSQISPVLMPPIAVPGHASYPSGHATQAHLLSGLLAQVMPAAVRTALPLIVGAQPPPALPVPLPPQPANFRTWDGSYLARLAERVARNREVLGMHYRSDTLAGRVVAGYSLPLLLRCPTVRNRLIPAARLEWQ